MRKILHELTFPSVRDKMKALQAAVTFGSLVYLGRIASDRAKIGSGAGRPAPPSYRQKSQRDVMLMDGFLGTRASLMMDLVVVAMAGVLPVLYWSVAQAKAGRYQLHKFVQVTLASVLLVVVLLFEADVRFFNPWHERAVDPSGEALPSIVYWSLGVHLCFAVSTFLIWAYVVISALMKFPVPVGPSDFSPHHRFWARIAVADMTLTACTGWLFYALAFTNWLR